VYLLFDTETTGKFDFKGDPNADHQPQICELAAMLTNDEGESMGEMNVLIKPDGWTIPAETQAVHGISTEQCEKFGIPLAQAWEMFAALLSNAETLVAHNIQFDLAMMKRSNPLAAPALSQVKHYCTMQVATDICRIRNQWGKFKWPSLAEAFRHFYGKDFKGAHRAMADVKACRAVFFQLKKLGL
jgi:DNA polymerase III epsilon subunit-like protein